MSKKRVHNKIYVILNARHKPLTKEVVQEILPWLREQTNVVKVDKSEKTDLSKIKADLLIVFGGDGTLLSVARRLKSNQIPVLGVNLGRLGFLAEVYPHELKTILPKILNGKYQLSPRMMLTVRATPIGRGKKTKEYLALNEVVISRRPTSTTLMAVRIAVSGEEIATHMSDGLIVSTATGSTAYSLSAGGPILSERLKAFTVVPICPHTLANRPLVLSGEETVEVKAASRTDEGFAFVVDGQYCGIMKNGSNITITRSPLEFNLISPGRRGRYEIIRDKLNWAGWVKEDSHGGIDFPKIGEEPWRKGLSKKSRKKAPSKKRKKK